mmetsp:Transcript_93/g.108  ORF Transcript_93/g.108 Transcript_93/m.108 type:complete len:239 (-) Transcript_93:552-1268(-)
MTQMKKVGQVQQKNKHSQFLMRLNLVMVSLWLVLHLFMSLVNAIAMKLWILQIMYFVYKCMKQAQQIGPPESERLTLHLMMMRPVLLDLKRIINVSLIWRSLCLMPLLPTWVHLHFQSNLNHLHQMQTWKKLQMPSVVLQLFLFNDHYLLVQIMVRAHRLHHLLSPRSHNLQLLLSSHQKLPPLHPSRTFKTVNHHHRSSLRVLVLLHQQCLRRPVLHHQCLHHLVLRHQCQLVSHHK